MKPYKYLALLPIILLGALLSCGAPGDSELILSDGIAQGKLPEELKGLKIYSVCIRDGQDVKIAVLDGKISTLSDFSGKTEKHTITLTKVEAVDNYSIPIKEIISETDSIIVARK